MKLCNIKIENYRNIKKAEIVPSPDINAVVGENAQGKTNLIEAVWLLTGNKSFRGSRQNELIRFNSEFFKIEAEFEDARRRQNILYEGSAKRKITVNGVENKKLSEFRGNFYSVVFSPSHMQLIENGPKARREFLDDAISEINPQYGDYLLKYELLTDQRNALLKNSYKYSDLKENIEIWDIQLAKIGTVLSIYRNDYVNKLMTAARYFYDGISSGKETFSIKYCSTVFEDFSSVKNYNDETISLYEKKIRENFETDLKQGFTSVGVHRDDMEILIDERSARSYGSQGQKRSAVIAIKLAEAELLKKITGETPVMLLDDIMSELDKARQDYILNKLISYQVFITCCDFSNLKPLQKGKIFTITNGEILAEQEIV